jgi:hypothetical protein
MVDGVAYREMMESLCKGRTEERSVILFITDPFLTGPDVEPGPLVGSPALGIRYEL